MGTILSDAANLYQIFNEDGVVSKAKIENMIAKGNYIEKRAEVIEKFYKLLFDSSLLNKVSILFVKTNMRYSNLAERFNIIYSEEILKGQMKAKSESNIKVDISYCNKKLESTLVFVKENGEKSNYIHELSMNGEVSLDVILKARKEIDLLEGKYFRSNVDKSKLLINLSNKEYCTAISEKEFKEFIETITPFFVNQRKIIQQKVNQQKNAVGYYNYLMKTPKEDLSETDKFRLEVIFQLMNPEIEKKEKMIYDKELRNLQEDYIKHEERIDEIKKEHVEITNEITDIKASIGNFFFELYKNKMISLDSENTEELARYIGEIKRLASQRKLNEGSLEEQINQIEEIENKITDRKERLQKKQKEKIEKQIKKQITDEQVQERIMKDRKITGEQVLNNITDIGDIFG